MKKVLLLTASITLSNSITAPEMGDAFCDMLDSMSCDASDMCQWYDDDNICMSISGKKGYGGFGFLKDIGLPDYAQFNNIDKYYDLWNKDIGYKGNGFKKQYNDDYYPFNKDDGFNFGRKDKYNDFGYFKNNDNDKNKLNGFYESNKYYGSVYGKKDGLGYGYGYDPKKKYDYDDYDKFDDDRFDGMWDFDDDRFDKDRFQYPEHFGKKDYGFDKKHYDNYGKGKDSYHGKGFDFKKDIDYKKDFDFKNDYDRRRNDGKKYYGSDKYNDNKYDFKY